MRSRVRRRRRKRFELRTHFLMAACPAGADIPVMDMRRSKWQIRCTTCGRTRDAVDAGIIRIGGHGRKYTLGWCSACRWLRVAAIEPFAAAPGEEANRTAGSQ